MKEETNTLSYKMMKYTFYQTVLIAARKIYSFKRSEPHKLSLENDADKVSELLRGKIESGAPLMASRFGAVELGCVVNHIGIVNNNRNPWLYIKGTNPAWWIDEGIRYCMKNNAGFFPNDDASLYKFGELMLERMTGIDVLASWLGGEYRVVDRFPNAKLIDFISLDPFWSKIPWTSSLTGKKVLVVHPFADEIKFQYETKRTEIHKNPSILPLFHLEVIKAVQSIGGNNKFSSWFEALNYMEGEIAQRDFDVCLIGCGAYGMPLAAYVKRLGKQTIHMGGSLQLLFGIRGKRWETTQYGHSFFPDGIGQYPTLMNDNWIRPFESSKFSGAEKVENGCYW